MTSWSEMPGAVALSGEWWVAVRGDDGAIRVCGEEYPDEPDAVVVVEAAHDDDGADVRRDLAMAIAWALRRMVRAPEDWPA